MDENPVNDNPFSTGGIPSPHDYRDVPLAAAVPVDDPVFAASMPAGYFEDVSALPVENQKKNGSCVGHAAAKYKQLIDRIETGEVIPYSPRFLYAIAKARDGYAGEGTYPRLVASIVKHTGIATTATCPNDSDLDHETYVYNRNEQNIPETAFGEADKAQIASYAFPDVKRAIELKAAIIRGRGAMLLMRIGEEWWRPSYAEKDVIPLRAPKTTVSGHEVYLYGFLDITPADADDLKNDRTNVEALMQKYAAALKQTPERTETLFFIFNSWSVDWGRKGTAAFLHGEYVQHLDESITFVDLPNDLKKRLKELPDAKTFTHNFATDIEAGARGPEVVALQTALMIDGQFDRDLYRELLVDGDLGYFKPNGVTQRAVLSFQRKHAVDTAANLTALNGRRVGPRTRAALNTLFNK